MFRHAARLVRSVFLTPPSRSLAKRRRMTALRPLEALEDRTVPSSIFTIYNTADAHEDGANGVFTITRTGYYNQAVTLNYSVGGAATPGDDYTALSGSINFAAYQTIGYLTVVAADDSVAEASESVTVTLTSGSGYTVGTPGQATIILYDNELPEIMVEHVNDAVEGGTDGKFTLTRTGNTVDPVEVSYSMSGTATAGTDYTSVSGTVTIAAGMPTAHVFIEAIHDGIADDGETAVLTLTSGTGYTIDSENGSGTVVLIEADPLPVAFDWWTTTSIGEPVIIDVLDLAVDLTPDELTVSAVSQGSDGSVAINQDGTVTYTPNTDFVGDDTFTYTVEDPFGNDATGTFTVTVTEPIAPPTSVWTAINTGVNIDVLEMAFDPDGDTLITTAVTQGTNGSVAINQDGSVTYTPNTSFTGDDSFTYTVEDPDENEATHTITVTVGPIDPVALDDEVTTPINTPADVEVLDLAFDPAGDTLELTGVTQGANGTVTINLDGSVTYTPDNNFEGTDSFTYTVEDEDDNPSTGTIEVRVGEEPESEVAGILDDIAAIETELQNYDENTPAWLQTAVPALVSQVTDYLSSVSSYLTNVNLDVTTLPNFAKSQIPELQGLVDKYNKVEEARSALFNSLKQSKLQIDTLKQQLMVAKGQANPNGAIIILLEVALSGMTEIQVQGAKSFLDLTLQSFALFTRAKNFAWSLAAMGAPFSMIPFPTTPADLDIDEIRPAK